MNIGNLFVEGNELLELTDAELQAICGGYSSHFGRRSNDNYPYGGSAYTFGSVTQNAMAVSTFNGSGPISANSGGFVGSYAANSYSNTWNNGTYIPIYL